MFTATLFTILKIWKQLKGPSIDRWMNGMSKMCEGGQKAQTCSYKINKSWGWNVPSDYS